MSVKRDTSMKKLIFATFLIVFSSFHAFCAENKVDSKPFSALGLTLGMSKTDVLKVMNDKKISVFYDDEKSMGWEKAPNNAECDYIITYFFEEHLYMLDCAIESATPNDSVSRFFTISDRLQIKYGKYKDDSTYPEYIDPDNISDLTTSLIAGSASLFYYWTPEDNVSIALNLQPDRDSEDYFERLKVIFISYSLVREYLKARVVNADDKL